MSQSESSEPQQTAEPAPADEASTESPAASPPPPAATRRTSPGRVPALPLALLALAVSLGLAVAGYFIWDRVQQLGGQQARLEPRFAAQLQPVQARLDALDSGWRQARRELEQRLDGLDDGQRALGERVNRLAALLGRSELGWTLAEVEYLLRVASESLQLRRDRRTAEAALKGADARLRELADPRLLPVREQLARELNALREVPRVDVDGISLRLSDWLQQVGGLPVAGSRYQPPPSDTPAFDGARTAHDWRDLPRVIWDALRELFRIREHDKPVGPMLPPERAWFLKENLRLQLAAARLALLREDPVAYGQALTTAASWLTAWFDTGDSRVQAMAAGLRELADIDIRPDLPDVATALQQLRQLRREEEALALPDGKSGNGEMAAPTGTDARGEAPSPAPPAEDSAAVPEPAP